MPINVEVRPRNNEPVERAIKRFNRKVKKEGIIDEWRQKHMYYEKPSSIRRREKKKQKKNSPEDSKAKGFYL
jgi:ribosomal protein S21